MITGIYKLYFLNSLSGNIYIGSTCRSFKSRLQSHQSCLRKNKHHSPALQNACNKYGIENLRLEILEECEPAVCLEREQFYIDTLKPEYNVCKIAGNTAGVRTTEYQKMRAKEVHKNNKYNLGRKHSKESIQKRIETRKLKGIKGPMVGRRHTKESRLKMSKSRTGVPISYVPVHLMQPIRCLNTNVSYNSVKEAIADISSKFGVVLHGPNVSDVLRSKRKHTKGFVFVKIEGVV